MDDDRDPPPHNGEPPEDPEDYDEEPGDDTAPDAGETGPTVPGDQPGEGPGGDRVATGRGTGKKTGRKTGRKKVTEPKREPNKAVDERYIEVSATRMTPHIVNLPDQRRVRCRGQKMKWDGHYDLKGLKEQVADWCAVHFGKGHIQVRVMDMEDRKKIIRNWTFDPDGEVNVDQIMEDLEKRPDCGMAVISAYGTVPPPQATQSGYEMSEVDRAKLEARKIEADADIAAAKIKKAEAEREADRRRRRLQEEEDREREEDELREEARKLGVPVKALERLKAQQDLAGPDYLFGPPQGGQPPQQPMNEMDMPMSRAEYYQQRETEGLRMEIQELKAALRDGQGSRSNLPELVTAIGTAIAPLVVAMQDKAARSDEAAREDRKEAYRILAESTKGSDKMMGTFLEFLKTATDQSKLSDDRILRLLEFGQKMGGEGGQGWISEIGTAVGEIGHGIVSALHGGKRPALPPPQGARAPAPQPGGVSGQPVPGYTTGALPASAPRAQLPPGHPPPATVPPPMPGGVSSGAPVAPANPPPEPAAVEEEEVTPMTFEQEMQGAVSEVVRSMLRQCQSRPQNAEWVEVAQGFLPEAAIHTVLETASENDLIEYFKPFVPPKLGVQFYIAMQGDPRIKAWLRAGLADLKELINESLEEQGDTPAPEVVTDESEDDDPVAEDTVQGEDHR